MIKIPTGSYKFKNELSKLEEGFELIANFEFDHKDWIPIYITGFPDLTM
jgi:hypothetical protein